MKDLIEYQNLIKKKRNVLHKINASESKISMDKSKKEFNDVYEETKRIDGFAKKLDDDLKKYTNVAEKGFSHFDKMLEDNQNIDELNYAELKKLDEKLTKTANDLKSIGKRAVICGNKINSAVKDYDNAVKTAKNAKANFLNSKSNYEKIYAQYKEEVEKLDEKIKDLEKKLLETNPDKLKLFNSKLKDKIFPVIVKFNTNNSCEGCGTSLATGIIEKINKDGWVICEQCGRIICK